jgi:hypothetical protein
LRAKLSLCEPRHFAGFPEYLTESLHLIQDPLDDPDDWSSFGRAGGRLRLYPGGTENASIFATVRGSIPKRRAASRRLIPSTYTARRTCLSETLH